jgi:hypothetical protein
MLVWSLFNAYDSNKNIITEFIIVDLCCSLVVSWAIISFNGCEIMKDEKEKIFIHLENYHYHALLHMLVIAYWRATLGRNMRMKSTKVW